MGISLSTNITNLFNQNGSSSDPEDEHAQNVAKLAVPMFYSLIFVMGFIGNLLVIIVVLSNRQMRNTTNLLIINLAASDLIFIIICLPFTALGMILPNWPFGAAWCKLYQYMVYVTAYASVYTLVLMSLDRYLAVVHPISSMSIRTERNAYFVIFICWFVICAANIFMLFHYDLLMYTYGGISKTACLNSPIVWRLPGYAQKFYGVFFIFGYCIPLALVCILYGLMLKRLLWGVPPGRTVGSSETMRTKRRVTRMIIIVVLIFAICWLPFHIHNILLHFMEMEFAKVFYFSVFANCFAYMNSCVNPILYAFLSENFRKSFRRLLCITRWQPVRMDIERTQVRLKDVTVVNDKTRMTMKGLNHYDDDDDDDYEEKDEGEQNHVAL